MRFFKKKKNEEIEYPSFLDGLAGLAQTMPDEDLYELKLRFRKAGNGFDLEPYGWTIEKVQVNVK